MVKNFRPKPGFSYPKPIFGLKYVPKLRSKSQNFLGSAQHVKEREREEEKASKRKGGESWASRAGRNRWKRGNALTREWRAPRQRKWQTGGGPHARRSQIPLQRSSNQRPGFVLFKMDGPGGSKLILYKKIYNRYI